MVLVASLLNTQHYKIQDEWSNSGKGIASSPTPLCGSYSKESLQVVPNYGQSTYIYIYIYIYIYVWDTYDKFPDFFRMGI